MLFGRFVNLGFCLFSLGFASLGVLFLIVLVFVYFGLSGLCLFGGFSDLRILVGVL